jgi:glycosyltransferase involved in cell wall biosynthesis
LVVSGRVPDPEQDSGVRRLHGLITLLADLGWTVSFLALDGIDDERPRRALERRGVGVADGQELTIDSLLAARPADLVLVAYWRNARAILPAVRRAAPDVRVIVDSVDLHFVREIRRALRPRGHGPLGLSLPEARSMGDELNTYAGADGVLTVSAKEADLLGDLTLDPDLAHVVPDFETFAPSTVPLERREGMVFIGSFDHQPNAEALGWLLREILPLLDPADLTRHPIRIIGHALTPELAGLGRDLSGVEMVGWVPDVRPYLDRARVSLAPLLHGAGTKRKVVQALMTGTPTVMTSVGAEGLEILSGRHAIVADDAVAFAAGITRLLRDDALWVRLQRDGASRIGERHGRDHARSRLDAAVTRVMARTPKRQVPLMVAGSGGVGEQEHSRRVTNARAAVEQLVPPDARVAVITRGDTRLLDLGGRRALVVPHPEHPSAWTSREPERADELIAHLEALRSELRCDHLVMPYTAFWWMERFPELRTYLERTTAVVHRDEGSAVLRWLAPAPARARPTVALPDGARPDRSGLVLIAHLDPAYHQNADADAWWGEGHTPWLPVARHRPLWRGHQQPRIPGDLGFTDLRLAETREAQAALARSAGITGFCYRHRWSAGHRAFGEPLQAVLDRGAPDLPFCLSWRVGPIVVDGRIVLDQVHDAADDAAHLRWLRRALEDPRAITVDGRALLLIDGIERLPDPATTIDRWREQLARWHHPGIHLVAVTDRAAEAQVASIVGVDAITWSQPDRATLDATARWRDVPIHAGARSSVRVFDHGDALRALAEATRRRPGRHETVLVGWDDTPDPDAAGTVLDGWDPDAYVTWLSDALITAHSAGGRPVFLEAWNRWTHGAVLEPDRHHGHARLDATRRAVAAALDAKVTASPASSLVVAGARG